MSDDVSIDVYVQSPLNGSLAKIVPDVMVNNADI
jgi:hypothetical protein